MNELLYVPKRIKDEELRNFSILVAGDNVFIKFLRFLSDCAYEVIYDKNFNVIKEGQFNMFDKDLWDRLKNYECDEGK